MGYGIGHRTYHTPVVRGIITKQLTPKTGIMVEEASLSFDDIIGQPKGSSGRTNRPIIWKLIPLDLTPISLYDVIATTVARVSNRVYVGTDFCEYLST